MLRSLIILLAGLFAALLVLREIRRFRSRRRAGRAAGARRVIAMRPCAHCGVHVPAQQALVADGKYYCSEEHRRAARRA